ncbi:MAG: hypothetical protein J5563_01235, partial [Clostridia bacterium]|nr:hypothetical protein [Clostridia bacterium]
NRFFRPWDAGYDWLCRRFNGSLEWTSKHPKTLVVLILAAALAAAFLVNIFSSPETRFMVVFFTLLQNVSIAGINGNMQNIVYSVVPEQCFVHAQVIKNSIAGIAGFLASLISGKILSVIQGGGNTFFGMRVYGQQIFSAFSFAVTTATVAYMTCVIKNPSVRDGK